jgi:agmatine deiminase
MSRPQVYLADTLPSRFPSTATALANGLLASGATVGKLPGTRDVWARDYMPVPTTAGHLVQFRYAPDYLRPKRWQPTITDGASVAQQLGLPSQASSLVVDGGNIVRNAGRVVMTDKVVRENPAVPRAQLLARLAQALAADRLDLIPAHPHDFTGHADGMLQLLNEHTALVNDCRRQEPAFWRQLCQALHRAGLSCIPLPYNPYANPSYTSAVGVYSNFLRVGTTLLVPVYQQAEDETALKCLQSVYPRHTLIPIDGRGLALQGGVFHCVTWSSTPEAIT